MVDDAPGFDQLLSPALDELRFVLPLYYIQQPQTVSSSQGATVHRVDSFRIGSVPFQRTTPHCRESNVPVVTRYDSLAFKNYNDVRPFLPTHPAFPTDPWMCKNQGHTPPQPYTGFENDELSIAFLGRSDWDVLSGYLDHLWYLGDGFEYQFAISAYRGWPGLDVGYVEGPRSDWLSLKGGADLACTDPTIMAAMYLENEHGYSAVQRTAHLGTLAAGNYSGGSPPADFAQALAVAEHYNCEVLLGPGGSLSDHGPGSDFYEQFERGVIATLGAPPRVLPAARGVLGSQAAPDLSGIYRASHLFGSSACGNLWNGTPASLTWDSPITRTVWHIAWVFALLIFLVVLLWDGLGITWDGMVSDGRGGSALKSMFPRFALALILAGLSLFICRIALTLTADVTCFVSHATGMTFFGFLGTVLGLTFGQVIVVFGLLVPMAWIPGIGQIALAAFLIILFTVLLFVVWYAIKVFFSMVGRIVLLLVLCGLSPLAFAMMASPSTSHWTKRWVTMFLGTAFQQVAVLVVLYASASLAKQFFGSGVGHDANVFWNTFIQLLMTLMALYLASKVPEIVNPSGSRLMSGFGQALGMVAGAAAIIGTAGAGAIMGAAAGAGGGLGGLGGGLRNAVGNIAGAAGRGGGGDGGGAGAGGGGGGGRQGGGGDNSSSPMSTAASNYGSDAGGATGFMTGGDPSSFQTAPTPGAAREATAGGPSVTSPPGGGAAVSAEGVGGAARQAAAGGGDGGGGGFRSRMGGFFDRVGRGAYHGAVRGQNISGSMQRVMRHGDFSAVPIRGYQRSQPVDVQSLRNYVNRRPIESDPEALDRMAKNRGMGFGGGRGYRGRSRDDDDARVYENDGDHGGDGGE